jgi:hypothetical protein
MEDLFMKRSAFKKLRNQTTKSIDIPNLNRRRGAFSEKTRHLSAGDSPVGSDAIDEVMESSPPETENDEEVSIFTQAAAEPACPITETVAFPPSAFDIVGPRKHSRYPWQRDVGIQCNILRDRFSSSDCGSSRVSDASLDPFALKVSSVDSGTGTESSRSSTVKAYLRHTVDLFDDHRGPRVHAIKDEWIAKRRSAALTEPDLDFLQQRPTVLRPKAKLSRMHSADSMVVTDCLRIFNGGDHRLVAPRVLLRPIPEH